MIAITFTHRLIRNRLHCRIIYITLFLDFLPFAQGMVPKLLELLEPPEMGSGDAITVMVSEKPARPAADRDGDASPVLSPKSHGSPMSRTVTWTWLELDADSCRRAE